MHNNLPISLIVFDCDGVLLESVDAKTRAFGRTVAAHGADAVDRLIAYHLENGGVSRFKKFEWFYAEVLGRAVSDHELQQLGERFEELSLEGVMNAPMVAGVRQALETLHGKMPLYVASGAPHEELIQVLANRGLDRFFDGIYGSPPDKTALLKRVIDQADISPGQTLMVGDSQTDLAAAEACGARFYGRGRRFEGTGWPWHEDMTRLVEYLSRTAP